jgi:hypothetical protein
MGMIDDWFAEKIVDPAEKYIEDVVDEGHKSGMLGTAFLHAWITIAAFMAGGLVGQSIAWLVSLVGVSAEWLAPVLAVVAVLRALWFYFKREFGSNGDFWEAYYLHEDERKMLDSGLDFVFPLLATIFCIFAAVMVW